MTQRHRSDKTDHFSKLVPTDYSSTYSFGSSAFISKVLSLEVHSYLLTCNTKNNQMSGLPIAWMKTRDDILIDKKKKSIHTELQVNAHVFFSI